MPWTERLDGHRTRRSGARGGAWVFGQLFFIAIAAALGFLGPPWPKASDSTVAMVGVVLGVLGIAMLVAGGAFLGSALTPYPKPLTGASLRRDGVYRLVRHPMYGGGILLVTGWSLASSPLGLLGTGALAAFLELKSRREETWLVERYPAYAAYRRQTRWKFVPGIR